MGMENDPFVKRIALTLVDPCRVRKLDIAAMDTVSQEISGARLMTCGSSLGRWVGFIRECLVGFFLDLQPSRKPYSEYAQRYWVISRLW